jgi:hypothetical protein
MYSSGQRQRVWVFGPHQALCSGNKKPAVTPVFYGQKLKRAFI